MQLPTLNGHRDLWRRITRALEFASKFRVGPVPPFADQNEPFDPDSFDAESQADPTGTLVERMLTQGRQALLLRPELITKMTSSQCQKARDRLANLMALVSGGKVTLTPWHPDDDSGVVRRSAALTLRQENVDAFWLDRFQVSNQQFQFFVKEGGYHNESFWADVARKRIASFVDRAGVRGPRFWNHGKFPAGLADHPVVGVCWYEADAFARWQGKRLASDSEWICAACSPLAADDPHANQRLYPWGQEPKTGVTNFWGFDPADHGQDRTVATRALPGGATEAGIEQLLGNVWEWTSSDFQIAIEAEEVEMDQPRKSLRGGAFDTYFGDQATCQLQSGDHPFTRKRNIGFRCAIDGLALAMEDRLTDE